MKRNLDTLILNIDGQPFEDSATLKTVCFLAATATLPTDQNAPIANKLALYALAQKLHIGGEVDLTAEEIALLKERIGKAFASVVVIGRAFELLEKDHGLAEVVGVEIAAGTRAELPPGTHIQTVANGVERVVGVKIG